MKFSKEMLRTHPLFFSRLGFGYDPPRYGADGKQILFSHDLDFLCRSHRDFEDADVRIHTTLLPTGWNGDGVFDYTLTDRILDALLGENPEIRYYIPRVKLNAPPEWCKNHPREVFVYEDGPRDADGIAHLADTAEQDWFGFDCDGYPINGFSSYRDDRPNRGGRIALQSFSSRLWQRDAADALRRLMQHIAASPYADRVVGYHIAFGMCGETSAWGGWSAPRSRSRGDFGIESTERFRRFGLEKYGSAEALLDAWGATSLDGIYAPSVALRDGLKTNLKDFFYAESPICPDYYAFCAEETANACDVFCREVKAFDPDLVTGVFYGYSYITTSAHTGHLAIDSVLRSPYIDFLASPKGYYRSLAGDPGGEQGPSYSINLKKTWIDEIDNRTFLDRRPDTQTKTLGESLTLLSREAIKNISYNQGFWWMDLAEGWYDHPDIMKRIAKLSALEKSVAEIPHKSVAQILLVTDERSTMFHTPSDPLGKLLHYELHSEAKLCGAPVDTLRLSDLFERDVTQYKLVIFTNAFVWSADEREKLSSVLHPDAVKVWMYAAGISLDGEVSLRNIKKLTGFAVEESRDIPPPTDNVDFPLFAILAEEGDEILARYADGRVMAAKREKEVLCAFPCLKADGIRRLADGAGCYLYAPLGTTVYADNRVIGIFPKYDVRFTLSLPHGRVGGSKEIPLSVRGKDAAVFVYDK